MRINNLSLVIVASELHGPVRNGGIGTAFAALAIKCAQAGMRVSIAYTRGNFSEDGPLSRWVEHYARLGIELLVVDEGRLGDMPALDAPAQRRAAWQVHHWLKARAEQFDVAIFPEWQGMAYYALLAKGQGLAYENMQILVNTHGPEFWAQEANRQLPSSVEFVELDFMERECVRRADAVVSPSAYLLDWMRAHQWALAANSLVIPNLMPKEFQGKAPHEAHPAAVRRVVFFGRLEARKGLKLFCDAIDRMPPTARSRIEEVVFLGRNILLPDGKDARTWIEQRSSSWGLPLRFLTDKNRDEALAELQGPSTLAVIPSLLENSPYTVLECLSVGVRFLASNVGGIPEIVAGDDHATHLFEPTPGELAHRLGEALENGIAPARLAWSHADVESRWLDLLRDLAEPCNGENVAAPMPQPRVSVCVVHYNRPHLLAEALAAVRAQTYDNIEVVLVDDGSPGQEAQAYLDGLEAEFNARGWQIIRQPNSYLGAARNTAARAARGEYLVFLDDDDLAFPSLVETFVRAAIHTDADVLTCVNCYFTGEKPPEKPERIWIPLGGAAGAGLYRNVFGGADAMWKRDAYWRIGGSTTDYGVGHEDWELLAQAVLSGLRLELVPEPLYWYRVNPRGMLQSGDRMANLARSVRAYVRSDPGGLGAALAYGLFLQQQWEGNAQSLRKDRRALVRAVLRAASLARDPAIRAQFLGTMRSQGFFSAMRRALNKASR